MIPGGRILQILEEECEWNPSDSDRAMFLYHYEDPNDPVPLEYRFMGGLGFGGKLWFQQGRLYVSCYREDETTERLQMIERADRRLEELVREYA